jgi:hypothetical protein
MRKPSIPVSPLPPTTAQSADSLVSSYIPKTDPNILTTPQGLKRQTRAPQRTLIGGSA